jgi:hypothetical protein
VARQLHEIITEAAPSHADSDHAALKDAAAALRTVPDEVAHAGRWALIEQTVTDMAVALDDGDMALLKDLTVDLDQLNQVRANGNRITAPDDLRPQIRKLLGRIDRRTKNLTK